MRSWQFKSQFPHLQNGNIYLLYIYIYNMYIIYIQMSIFINKYFHVFTT